MAKSGLFAKALAALAIGAAIGAADPACAASRRVALIIGNAAYASLPPLENSVNDATKVRDTLRDAGFETFFGANIGHLDIEELLRKFFRDVDNADIALIYYSGHGVQVAGDNFIVPVDAKLSTPYDIEQQTLKVGDIFNYLAAHSRAQVIFLDACRNNPFKIDRFWIGDTLKSANVKTGLARASYGVGSLIAFSTEPGAVAYDGEGKLSPYTSALVRHITAPNEEIRRALTLVRREVISATDGLQVPWENSSLTDDLYLMPAPPGPKAAAMVRVSVPAAKVTQLSGPRADPVQRRGLGDPHRAAAGPGAPDARRAAARRRAVAERGGFRAAGVRRQRLTAGRDRPVDLFGDRPLGAKRPRRSRRHRGRFAAAAAVGGDPGARPGGGRRGGNSKLDKRNAVATVAVGPVDLRLEAAEVKDAPR